MAPALGLNPVIPAITSAHAQAATEGPVWRHALSVFGDVKYPADFKRYDYVNPNAPKGGVVRMFEQGTFDNFNIVVSGFKGSLARGASMIVETLLSSIEEFSNRSGNQRIRPARSITAPFALHLLYASIPSKSQANSVTGAAIAI